MFKIASQVIQRVGDRHQCSGRLVLLLYVSVTVANNNADALENMQLIDMTSDSFKPTFDILIKRFGLCQRRLISKNTVSMLRS